MNKLKLFLLAALALCGNAFAQTRDIGLQVGLNVPMSDKSMIGSDMMLGVSYGQFHYNGLGFRAGFQYAASTADINDVFGVPVAFAYRTKSKSAQERFETGAFGARDAVLYRHPYGSGNAAGFLGGFLVNLFSDMEFFAGMTPGYILCRDDARIHRRRLGTAGKDFLGYCNAVLGRYLGGEEKRLLIDPGRRYDPQLQHLALRPQIDPSLPL